MKKKLVLLLCLITCLFAITACSSKEKATFEYDEATVKENATELMDSWNQMDFSQYSDEQLDQLVATGQMAEEASSLFANWRDIQADIGNFVKVNDVKIEESKDIVTVVFTATYDGTKNKVTFKVPLDSSLNIDTSAIQIEENKSFGEKMEFALVNTVISMGTVFVVLIFISLLIAMFKIIPMIQAKMAKKQEEEMNEVDTINAIESTVSVIAEQEEKFVEEYEEELVDDGELVAVITAAIMAYRAANHEEIPADGLFVRSIKRSRSNNWKKA